MKNANNALLRTSHKVRRPENADVGHKSMKEIMKALCTIALASLLTISNVHAADIPDDKRTEIERMLRLTGTEQMFDQIMNQTLAHLSSSITEVPDGFWEEFRTELNTRDLIEQIIPLYDKYYTLEDLRAINDFYGSPVGRKVMATLPQIMQEGSAIGQAWAAMAYERAEIKARNVSKQNDEPNKALQAIGDKSPQPER